MSATRVAPSPYATPSIEASWTAKGLSSLTLWGADSVKPTPVPTQAPYPEWEALLKKKLAQFFKGQPEDFSDLPLDLSIGTPFQQAVWRGLLAIPYGETRSYGELAKAIGRPKAVRAVGQANRRNPIQVIVPCHRVLGQNGQLTGYMGTGGIPIKQWLLELESCK